MPCHVSYTLEYKGALIYAILVLNKNRVIQKIANRVGWGWGVSGGQDFQYSEFYKPVRTKILKQLLDYILIDWLYLRRY